MLVDSLRLTLEKHPAAKGPFLRTVLKERLQDYLLNFVYNAHEYRDLIFTGGSCLRKLYGLNRLSEDLDFDFIGSLNLDQFAQDAEKYFKGSLGYKDLTTKQSGNQNTIYFKFPILEELGLAQNLADSQVLFVRCDFSQVRDGKYATQTSMLSTPEAAFFAKSYDLPTLFAHKVTAFLTRDFFKSDDQKESFKGRDIYDLFWLFQRSEQSAGSLDPNWDRVFELTGMADKQTVLTALRQKLNKIDPRLVYTDLLPFLENPDLARQLSQNLAELLKRYVQS